jgi:hypothetical protein
MGATADASTAIALAGHIDRPPYRPGRKQSTSRCGSPGSGETTFFGAWVLILDEPPAALGAT